MNRGRLHKFVSNCDPSILLHPQIPKPLHGVNPRSIKGDVWWRQETERIRNNTRFCQACGVLKIGQAFDCHEEYLINHAAGIATFSKIVCICKDCHDFIHIGRLKNLLDKNLIEEKEYERIKRRGRNILAKYNLTESKIDVMTKSVKCAKWSEWKLIFEGKEYYPKFKSFEEWRMFYDKAGS